MSPSKPHDLGGLPAGPIDQREVPLSQWDWQMDAMVRLLFDKGLLLDFAQLRDGIEQLSADAYEELSYYEKWASSASRTVEQCGVVTSEELQQRISELEKQRDGSNIEPRPE